ncbi:unnamed protein product [Schistosoma margrebowiei]|uniref:Uncharacterized protein n=1 Tax=Schistosoma margrebowiei TaxID=48269 RepID=A0A183MZQ2_9TREM|nr:unnamed protein product [Schistosoma margrebowiei]
MHTHKHIRLPPSTKWLCKRFHCQLKSALRAHEDGNWHETLPFVLLGVRTSLKADIQCSVGGLVYGTTLRLPGEFFTPRSRPNFDSVSEPWQQPYKGSFHAIARHEKTFKVDRYGRVEIVSIDRLKSVHVDDSSLSDTLRYDARPIKPSGILNCFSDPTLDTSKTSFSRPGQQHASSALSTDETTVSRPDQQTTPPLTSGEIAGSRNTNETTVSRSGRRVRLLILFLFPEPTPSTISVCFRRLQSTLAKAGLINHALVSALSRYIDLNVWHTLGLELGRCGRFWSFGSTWFRPTSAAFLVRILYERNLQILDANHLGSMPTQAKVQHIAPGTVLRK